MKMLAITGLFLVAVLSMVNAVMFWIGSPAWLRNNKAIIVIECIIGIAALIYFVYSMYMEKWYA